MTTVKRDQLVSASVLLVAGARDELNKALRFVGENNFAEVVAAIKAAQEQLAPLVDLIDEANEEKIFLRIQQGD